MATGNSQTARFIYLQWQELYEKEKPFQVFATVDEESTEKLSNLVFAQGPPVTICDLRGQCDHFTLDQNGFMVRHDRIPDVDFSTEEAVRQNILPRLEELIRREVEGADVVYCFDWGVRRSITKFFNIRLMKSLQVSKECKATASGQDERQRQDARPKSWETGPLW